MKHPLFAHPEALEPEHSKQKEISYSDAKKVMLDYCKNYLVKSYLILNTNAKVKFASQESDMET